MQGLALDLTERELVLHSAAPDYHLELKLPYAVDHDNSQARFNKQLRQLVVTLPLCPPPPPPPSPPFVQPFEVSPSSKEDDDAASAVEHSSAAESVTPAPEEVAEMARPPMENQHAPSEEKGAAAAPITPGFSLSQTSDSATVVIRMSGTRDASLSFRERVFGPLTVHTAHVSFGAGGSGEVHSVNLQLDAAVDVAQCSLDASAANMVVVLRKTLAVPWHRLQVAVDGGIWVEHRFLTAESLAKQEAERARRGEDSWRWPAGKQAAAAAILAGASAERATVRFAEAPTEHPPPSPAAAAAAVVPVAAAPEIAVLDTATPLVPTKAAVTLSSNLVFALE
jgi:hypothetical protein